MSAPSKSASSQSATPKSATAWHGSVIDAPGSEPFAVVGDLVLAVRTPRSRDFVTVEVGAVADALWREALGSNPRSSRPLPCFSEPWDGEVMVHQPVSFHLGGARYRLTLDRLSEPADGPPWVVCDFLLERV